MTEYQWEKYAVKAFLVSTALSSGRIEAEPHTLLPPNSFHPLIYKSVPVYLAYIVQNTTSCNDLGHITSSYVQSFQQTAPSF